MSGILGDNPAIVCCERLLELAGEHSDKSIKLPDNHFRTIRQIESFAGVYYGIEHFSEMREEVRRTAHSLTSLGKKPLRCAIIGEFSAGKSSVINALVEKPDFLPVDISETTALISRIEHAAFPNVYLEMRDGSQRESNLEEFRSLVNQNEDSELRKEVAIVNVQVDYPALRTLSIYDTPGLNSKFESHERITKGYISEAEVILWVFKAGQAGSATELGYVNTIKNHGCKVYGIVNKIDTVRGFGRDEKRWREEFDPVMLDLNKNFGNIIERFIPLSAKEALAGMTTGDSSRIDKSNIAELRQVIKEEIADKASTIREEHLAVKAAHYVGLGKATQNYLNEIVAPVKKGLKPLYKRLELMVQEARDFTVEDNRKNLPSMKRPW